MFFETRIVQATRDNYASYHLAPNNSQPQGSAVRDCDFPLLTPNSFISTWEPDRHQHLSTVPNCATCPHSSMRMWGATGSKGLLSGWKLLPSYCLLSPSFGSTEQSSAFYAPLAQRLEQPSPKPGPVLEQIDTFVTLNAALSGPWPWYSPLTAFH